MNLSPKELKRDLFVRYYLQHLNTAEAYERAGFSPNDANANRYFHRDDVQESLEKHAAKVLQKLDISIERTIKHIAAIAYGNALDVMEYKDEQWRFKELHELPPWVGVTLRKFDKKKDRVTYLFEPKVPALKLLLKFLELRAKSLKKNKITIKYE